MLHHTHPTGFLCAFQSMFGVMFNHTPNMDWISQLSNFQMSVKNHSRKNNRTTKKRGENWLKSGWKYSSIFFKKAFHGCFQSLLSDLSSNSASKNDADDEEGAIWALLKNASFNCWLNLPETNQNAPENGPKPRKEMNLRTIPFQGLCWFQGG